VLSANLRMAVWVATMRLKPPLQPHAVRLRGLNCIPPRAVGVREGGQCAVV